MEGFYDGGFLIINVVIVMVLAAFFHVGRDDWFFALLAFLVASSIGLGMNQAIEKGYLTALANNKVLYFTCATLAMTVIYIIILDAKLLSALLIALLSAIAQIGLIKLMQGASMDFVVLDDWLVYYKILNCDTVKTATEIVTTCK